MSDITVDSCLSHRPRATVYCATCVGGLDKLVSRSISTVYKLAVENSFRTEVEIFR